MRSSPSVLAPAAVAATLVALLAGCSSGAQEAPPTATATVTTTATPVPLPSPQPTSTPGPDGASGGGGDLGDGASGAAADRCTVDELQGSIDDGGGGGAAGSYGVALVLTNSGDRTCTLQGWPGVSFVGGGDGTQLGASATLDRSSEHPTVQLAPGDYAQAILTMVQAANYDEAECRPEQSEGFRVYPPGSTAALYIGAGGALFTACTSTDVQQLSVGAIQPGP